MGETPKMLRIALAIAPAALMEAEMTVLDEVVWDEIMLDENWLCPSPAAPDLFESTELAYVEVVLDTLPPGCPISTILVLETDVLASGLDMVGLIVETARVAVGLFAGEAEVVESDSTVDREVCELEVVVAGFGT